MARKSFSLRKRSKSAVSESHRKLAEAPDILPVKSSVTRSKSTRSINNQLSASGSNSIASTNASSISISISNSITNEDDNGKSGSGDKEKTEKSDLEKDNTDSKVHDNDNSKGLFSGILSMVGNQINNITSTNNNQSQNNTQNISHGDEESHLVRHHSPQASLSNKSIKDIQFKTVKAESPINTLGHGNLTLSNFITKSHQAAHHPGSIPDLVVHEPSVNHQGVKDPLLQQRLLELQKKQEQGIPFAPSRNSSGVALVGTPPNERQFSNSNATALSASISNSPRNNRIVSQSLTQALPLRANISPVRNLSPKRYASLKEPSSAASIVTEKRKSLNIQRRDDVRRSGAGTPISRSGSRSSQHKNGGAQSTAISENLQEEQIPPQNLGLVFASERKQKEFHSIFKKLDPSEKLYIDYVCALQKDILSQGKLYVSENYISFYANILGWVTNISIPFDEIVQIEKKTTAKFIPNALTIQTLHNRYFFTSFISRDSTFDFITMLWNHAVRGSDLDRSSDFDSEISDDEEDDDLTDSGYDTDEGLADSDLAEVSGIDDMTSSFNDSDTETPAVPKTRAKSEGKFSRIRGKSFSRRADKRDSDKVRDRELTTTSKNPASNADGDGGDSNDALGDLPKLGPLKHAPTKSPWVKKSNETEIQTVTFNAPLGTVFSLLFGENDSTFARSLIEKQKNIEISDIPEYSKNPETGLKERKYNYVKPLTAPVGPKQTRCNITETIEVCDIENEGLVQILQVTHSPDVPSGNSFLVSTRFYMTWTKNNNTLVQIVTFIDWTSKSWLKGPIETGTINGQKESIGILVDAVNEEIRSKSPKSGRSKTKKRVKSKKTVSSIAAPSSSSSSSSSSESPLSKLYSELDSILSIIPIPFLPSSLKTPLLLCTFVIVFSIQFNKLFGSSQRSFDNVDYVSTFDGPYGEYIVIPPIQRVYGNKHLRHELQIGVWDWIDSKIEGNDNDEDVQAGDIWRDQYYGNDMNADQKQYAKEVARNRDLKKMLRKYSKQELTEYVKLNELRLEELKQKLEKMG